MMYQCTDCLCTFEHPLIKREAFSDDGFQHKEELYLCPECGSTYYITVDECPVCHGYKPRWQGICEGCKDAANAKFVKAMSCFTRHELDYIDNALDGVSIKEFIEEGV